jgi:hypothetical protein
VRFGVAHKTATYLMVGAAYVGLVGGGGVSPLIALLGLLGLVTSWWWEPPIIRYEKWVLPWTIASLLVLAYTVLSAIATGDYLGIGGEFLIWLTVAKACNRRAARDWQQLYLLSFLMLVAGSVLNADLNYGIAFLVFVVASTWALTLFHLRREMEDNFLLKHADDRASERVEVRRILASRRIVDRRFFLGTGAVSIGVFVASAVFFLAMPRIGMGFFFKTRDGLNFAGFNEKVQLGGHGRIKLDSTVVMRVELPEKYGGRSAPMIHWRGTALDQYGGGEWSQSKTTLRTQWVVTPWGGTTRIGLPHYTSHLAWDRAPKNLTRQDIYIEPMDSPVLFAASPPSTFQVEVPKAGLPHAWNDDVRIPHGSDTFHYVAFSDLEAATADELRAAPTGPLPDYFWMYLQLPSCDPVDDGEVKCPPGWAISDRTRALAQEITAPYANNYDKAVAIVAWLQTNATYTLDLAETPDGQEPIDFFLFDRKKGHCEYFASAFSVLARAAGIPSRNVNGFLGGEWNDYYVAVRAGDAHAWSEVYFPGHGWVTFDATPSGNVDMLGRGGGGILARLRRLFDRVRFQWTKWVIEYDLVRQLSVFRGVGRALKAAGRAVVNAVVAVKNAIVRHWYASVPIGLLLVALIVIRIRRKRARGDDPAGGGRDRRRRRPVAEVWQQVIARLGKRGLARDPALTPRQLARRWTEPGSDELRELTELYYAVEYGGADEAAALPRARTLRDAIEAAAVTSRTRA